MVAEISQMRSWPRRYVLVIMCALSAFVCYMDRVSISIAIVPMASEYGWGPSMQGVILSSFFVGYLGTQVLGGWLADRHGGKVVLGCGVLLWSFFTFITPVAAATSLAALLVARIGMGLGEGVAFPAVMHLFARWVPAGERARSVTFLLGAIPLGMTAALLLAPWVAVTWGWPMVFYSFGLLGVLWYPLWQSLAADTPEAHPNVSLSERAFIREHSPLVPENESIPWRLLLSKKAVWAIIVNHFCSDWGFYVILSWLPTFFHRVHGIDLAHLGVYSILPWLVMFLMINVGGWIADGLLRRGLSITFVRKLMQSVGSFGPALFLVLIGDVGSAAQAMLYMCLVLGLAAFALSGFAVNHLDIGPRYAGILLGLSNTAGTLPGIVGVGLTGWILEATGSWTLVFQISAAVYVFGGVVWLLFATGKLVFR